MPTKGGAVGERRPQYNGGEFLVVKRERAIKEDFCCICDYRYREGLGLHGRPEGHGRLFREGEPIVFIRWEGATTSGDRAHAVCAELELANARSREAAAARHMLGEEHIEPPRSAVAQAFSKLHREFPQRTIDPPELRPDVSALEGAYRTLLEAAEGFGGAERDGLRDTPARAARAWADLTAGYTQQPPVLRTFEATHDEVVAVAPIPFYSLCEHHLLPFHGQVYVAYLPGERILGLSKFARVVHHFARRLQVQERLTTEIADYLEEGLANGTPCGGLAVVVKAEHLCMSMRGAQVPGAITTTSVMRGAFRDKPEARAEVLGLLGA